MSLRNCLMVVGLLSYGFLGSAQGAIVIGPWTFDERAFADHATRLDVGLMVSVDERLLDDAGLNEVLTGYSPSQGLGNIGTAGFANHFQLDFYDMVARNDAGPDIVFFDARFSADAYEIAVHPAGGAWSAFLSFAANAFVDTDAPGPIQPPGDQAFRHSVLFGLPIELSDFGVASGSIVDAIQFRALAAEGASTPQGDPVMAAVLNGAVVPEPASLLTWLLLGFVAVTGGRFVRRSRSVS